MAKSYRQILEENGYQVPTDDEDLIILNGQKVLDCIQTEQPLPKDLSWS